MTENHLEFLSLKGGCTGSSESTHVKMPHCWKSCVAAQLCFFSCLHLVKLLEGIIPERRDQGSHCRSSLQSDLETLASLSSTPGMR